MSGSAGQICDRLLEVYASLRNYMRKSIGGGIRDQRDWININEEKLRKRIRLESIYKAFLVPKKKKTPSVALKAYARVTMERRTNP